jgi:8-oxo-dGTP diphosphatase
MSRNAFSVAVFLVNFEEVLLVKHKRLGLWLPTGGEVEGNETPLEAARREVEEETGFKKIVFPRFKNVLDGEPPGFLGYEEHPCGSKGLHMNFNFMAYVPSRDIVSDGSFTEHQWRKPGDLILDTAPNVQQCMIRVQRELMLAKR